MFGRKARKLEDDLNQSQQEVAILAKKVETLSAALEEYKAKETAISGALTSAQRTADKLLIDAHATRDAILEAAENKKAAALEEASVIVDEANREADEIHADATEKAQRLTLQAEAFMAEYRAQAARLNESLQAAAAAAAAQAEQFRSFAAGTQLEGETELAGEYMGVSDLLVKKQHDLPEDYDAPADLMRSIYAIQKRELAQVVLHEPADEPLADAEELDHIWTVNEIMEDEPEEQLSPEDAGLSADLDAIINDVLGEV